MPGLMFPLWLALAVSLWAYAVRGLRTVWAAEAGRRLPFTVAIVACVIPPTVVLGMTAFVLFQAAPTVQFNAGSSRALEVWSFWARWHLVIFGLSAITGGIYAVCSFGSLLTKPPAAVRETVWFAFLTSLWGSILLGMAYPSA